MDKQEMELSLITDLQEVARKYLGGDYLVEDIVSVILKYGAVTAFATSQTSADAMELIQHSVIEAANVKKRYDEVHGK